MALHRDRVYSRDDVEALIADGRHVFIHSGRVIKADAWLKFHPGGDTAIKHMVGRDATDEVNAYVRCTRGYSKIVSLMSITVFIRQKQELAWTNM